MKIKLQAYLSTNRAASYEKMGMQFDFLPSVDLTFLQFKPTGHDWIEFGDQVEVELQDMDTETFLQIMNKRLTDNRLAKLAALQAEIELLKGGV